MNVKKIVSEIVERFVGEFKTEENIEKINNDIVDPLIKYAVNNKLKSIINSIYFYIIILTIIIIMILVVSIITLALQIQKKTT